MCDGKTGASFKKELFVSFENGYNFDKQRWGIGLGG